MITDNITGVVLAGGSSKRFGGLVKSKIRIGGKTIISRIIDELNEVFEEIIIVTNTPDEFRDFSNYRIVGDRFLQKGPLGGIHSALKESTKDASFIFAGDMPLLDKKLITKQIEYFRLHSCDVLVPRVNDYFEPLHSIYRNTLLDNLENHLSTGDGHSVMSFIMKERACFFDLEGSEDVLNAFININTYEEIPAVEKILASRNV
jgi:molybdopterin-guanine dinucleotide biosynthesis protein A